MGVGRSARALTDHVVSGNLFLYTQFIILTYIVIRKLAQAIMRKHHRQLHCFIQLESLVMFQELHNHLNYGVLVYNQYSFICLNIYSKYTLIFRRFTCFEQYQESFIYLLQVSSAEIHSYYYNTLNLLFYKFMCITNLCSIAQQLKIHKYDQFKTAHII